MNKFTTFATAFVVTLSVLFAANAALACATVPVAGTNYTVKADPTCVFAAESVQDDFTTDLTDLDFAK